MNDRYKVPFIGKSPHAKVGEKIVLRSGQCAIVLEIEKAKRSKHNGLLIGALVVRDVPTVNYQT